MEQTITSPVMPLSNSQPATRSLQIGSYKICPVPTGTFGLDGGAMFGTVPKVL